MNKIELHKDLCDKMHKLYINKNSDYGDSVHQTFQKYGLVSFLVRIEDKLNRVKSLSEKDSYSVKDEKIEDTLLDLANYALIALVELYEERNNLTCSEKEIVNDYSLMKTQYELPKTQYELPKTPYDMPKIFCEGGKHFNG